jgi:hypothetical protein
MVGGRTHSARVVDLANGSAAVRGAPALQAGTRGTPSVDGVGFPLDFAARSSDGELLHVAFDPGAAATASFRGVPERLAQRHVCLDLVHLLH